jgi:hypothetical protein
MQISGGSHPSGLCGVRWTNSPQRRVSVKVAPSLSAFRQRDATGWIPVMGPAPRFVDHGFYTQKLYHTDLSGSTRFFIFLDGEL